MSYTAKRTKSNYIRRKLLACRQRLELTQQEVADLAHIDRGYYTSIENGKREPSRTVMMNIAKVLGVKKWWELFELQAVADNMEVKDNE